mmetsp:Transcript_14558/g.20550  ORF Transcript_14558/g.20550 Transcript_14558/m.20550 type:complete len:464 (+) Transcript_14558:206-1597(+)
MDNRNPPPPCGLNGGLQSGDIQSQLAGFDQAEQLLAATRISALNNLGTNSLSALLGVRRPFQDSLALGLDASHDDLSRSLPVSALSSALTMSSHLARQRAIQQALSASSQNPSLEQRLRILRTQQLLQQQHELLLLQDPASSIVSQSAATEMTNEDILNMTGLRKDPKKASGKGSRPKKPKDMPRRPLSAYNIFFKEERAKILGSATAEGHPATAHDNDNEDRKTRAPHGKIGFENLAKTIGRRWKSLNPSHLERFKVLAHEDMERYRREMDEYRISQGEKKRQNDLIIAEQKECHKASASTKGDKQNKAIAETRVVTTETQAKRGKRKLVPLHETESISSPPTDKRPEQYQRSYLKRMKLNNPFAPTNPTSTSQERDEQDKRPPDEMTSAPIPAIHSTLPGVPGIGTNSLLARALAIRSSYASNEDSEQINQNLAAASSLLALPQGSQNVPMQLNRMRFNLP